MVERDTNLVRYRYGKGAIHGKIGPTTGKFDEMWERQSTFDGLKTVKMR